MKDIIEIINNSERCAVIPHVKVDGDAIGSCLAMRSMLKRMGKTAVIYAEEKVERRLKFLEKNIITVYNGGTVDCDTCIALDCGDMERLGKRAEIFNAAAHTINIDHHRTNTFFAEANYVEAELSSTGEILFKLFREMGRPLDSEIARYLYASICSDTGCFAYSNVSPDTFRAAAELISYDIDHAELARLLFDCVDLRSEKMKAELVSKINSYYGGKLRVVSVSKEDTAKFDMEPEEIQDLVNLPRRIRGTEIAAAIKKSEDKIRVSLRSNGSCDVAEIALCFGGGGHTKAAGCTLADMPLDEAEQAIVKACEGAFNG